MGSARRRGLIDNIFVNNPEQVLISDNLITDVSDHFSQFCILTSTRDKIKRKQIKKRDLSHFNPDSLNSDLATIDWSCIIKTHANNVDELFSTFYRNFNKIINRHAPIKTLSRRRINRNLENLVTHYLQELGIHFNIIGVTETKITNSNENTGLSNIPGYVFEHVPTPLACGDHIATT